MRDRITFKRAVLTDDGSGGSTESLVELFTVSGQFKPSRGKEATEGDRLNDTAQGVVLIRSSSESRTIVETDIAVIDDVEHQIRSVINPDRRKKMIELIVERGVVV